MQRELWLTANEEAGLSVFFVRPQWLTCCQFVINVVLQTLLLEYVLLRFGPTLFSLLRDLGSSYPCIFGKTTMVFFSLA